MSEIVALNDHEFLVDERDGKGLGDGSNAKFKELFKIDMNGAVDVSNMDGRRRHRTPFRSHCSSTSSACSLTTASPKDQIPAKIEGVALGADVIYNGTTMHTVWVANDNDFLQDFDGQHEQQPEPVLRLRLHRRRPERFDLHPTVPRTEIAGQRASVVDPMCPVQAGFAWAGIFINPNPLRSQDIWIVGARHSDRGNPEKCSCT